MKIVGTETADGRTRDTVVRLVQQSGPQTAAALAERLALSPAAIRRHLDALVAAGVLAEVAAKPSARRPRGRGRPARLYALTDAGRSRFGHAYDDLAATALRYLRNAGGEQALVDFAEHRAAGLTEDIRSRLAGVPAGSTAQQAAVVAEVLTEAGYVADTAPAGHGTQICQHHCPVAHVAAEFPQLCEAETEAFGRLLGTPVQRLATIAHGDGICTTHVTSVGKAVQAEAVAVPVTTENTPESGGLLT